MKKIIIAALAVMMILAGCNNSTPAPQEPTADQTGAVISVIGALTNAPEGVINIDKPEGSTEVPTSGDITITGTITDPIPSPEGAPAGIPASTVTGGTIDIKISLATAGTTPEDFSMTATISANSSVEATITPSEEGSEPYDTTISLTGSTTIDVLSLMGGMGDGTTTPTADEIKELINKVDLGSLTLKMGETSIDIKSIAGNVIDMMYPAEEAPAPEN